MNLRFAEEITLLMLNDEDGEFVRVPGWSMQCAFAGAVLMDLALENRIDTDLRRLVLIDPTPVGDDLLDPTLALIAQATETHDAGHWVDHLADRSEEFREGALARLVERGILRREDDRFLWVFQSRRYPVIDGEAEREVKLRIMEVLFSNEIPDPTGHRADLSRGRLRYPQGAALRPGAGTRVRAHRSGAQAGPDWPGSIEGGLGHPVVDRPGDAPDILNEAGPGSVVSAPGRSNHGRPNPPRPTTRRDKVGEA